MSQRMEALALANERRAELTQLRRLIAGFPHRQGRSAVASILRAPSPEQERIKADYLLASISRFGPARRGTLLRKVGLAAGRFGRSLSELSERERHLIADHLENPDLPAHNPEFTDDELELIEKVASRLSRKTNGETGDLLRSIAFKASRNLTRMDEPRGQQADGHGVPELHPGRARGNGQSGIAADVHDSPCAGASAADLEGVAA